MAHSLTVTPEAVFSSTYDVIKEYATDNVIYLELRSTPRAVDGQMSKQEYLEAIIKAFWSVQLITMFLRRKVAKLEHF